MKLPATEVALLESASATAPKTIASLAEEIGEKPEALTRAAFELEAEDLISIEERTETTLSLTEEGRDYLEAGLPELRLYRAAVEAGADAEPVPMGQVIGASGLEGPAVDIALANFPRKGLGTVEAGELTADPEAAPANDPEAAALAAADAGDPVDADAADRLVERGLLERADRTERAVTLTDAGVTALMEGVEPAETVGQVTPELLTSGEWADVEFAEYNVEADAEPVVGGRTHILRQTAESVKDTLVGMGFQEMEGPHADADFWINDALFMPQDHPARTHWDRFTLDVDPMADLPDDLVDRVEDAHRNGVGADGEGYHSPWDRAFAEEVALRGHTTSLSMRYLSGHQVGALEPPQRYFSVEKVYRNDTLDPTHLLEFFQIEGWVMADDLSVRDLMGTFTEFYERFGITDIEFKPHYNPYTEPSFELFGTHPETGDIVEIGNSGIFREEVLSPLGVEHDVMAWGLALERLLMLMYGFEDIRDVHGTLCDLDLLRTAEVVH
jgi:phenylalanyl-tRNA synthetase alpha chain